jgi:hypothetical protein
MTQVSAPMTPVQRNIIPIPEPGIEPRNPRNTEGMEPCALRSGSNTESDSHPHRRMPTGIEEYWIALRATMLILRYSQ